MNPVEVFDSLLAGVTFMHGQLPSSVEKKLINIGTGEISRARSRIKNIPDMLSALRESEFQLRSWLMDMSWCEYGEDKQYRAKRKELEDLINQIHNIFLRIT